MSVDRARVVLEQAAEPWRSALQKLLLDGVRPCELVTWFAGTSLERRGEFAIVRAANAFAAHWLHEKYRPQVARALDVEPARVVFALQGQDVQLEPEPVDEEGTP